MRLGVELPQFDKTGPRVWIHALSVGETNSVAPLVQALKVEWPEVEIVFSSATETGRTTARTRLSHLVSRFFYMPHDFPWAVDRLIRSIKPDLFVLVETDVWPNLLRTLKHHSIPSVLVNGRLSPKSFGRMLAVRPLVSPVFELFDQILVQSRDDGERYAALGASRNRVLAMGNLKFDAALEPSSGSDLSVLREELGLDGERKVWVAGSTHEGEEELLIDIHKGLLRRDSGLLLIVAPRDVRRGAAILEICEREGLSVGRRSMRDKADGAAVYVLDTLGELRRIYGLADAVFIGGSLVPLGGHNPLEAVAHGKPVYWGPHLFNFREIGQSLTEADCGRRVGGLEELQQALSRCLEDAAHRARVQRTSVSFMREHGGAAGRMARFLHHLCVERRIELE
jgi:3-deoxy-D-manno-octulosonic-acid transferase